MKPTIDEPNNLDEPHFDEEATILAARPVVPLDEVRETKRSKRSKGGLALVLAIVGGLLIGLLAAGLIFRYLGVGEPVETTVAEQPAPVVEQPSVESPGPAGGDVAAVDEEAEKKTADQKPVVAEDNREPKQEESRAVRTPNKPTEVEPRRPVVVRDTPRPADDEADEEADREMRRSQRQEERRERRRAERQANRQERQKPSDDLTRIREIFEGAPRP